MRDIGFVVGQTNWDKMMDDSHAEKALNRTKYIWARNGEIRVTSERKGELYARYSGDCRVYCSTLSCVHGEHVCMEICLCIILKTSFHMFIMVAALNTYNTPYIPIIVLAGRKLIAGRGWDRVPFNCTSVHVMQHYRMYELVWNIRIKCSCDATLVDVVVVHVVIDETPSPPRVVPWTA